MGWRGLIEPDEMLPTDHYDVWAPGNDHPGTGWLYFTDKGFVAIMFDDDQVLTVTNEDRILSLWDPDRTRFMQNYLFECAEAGLSTKEARKMVIEYFGEPDKVIELPSINNPSEEFCAAWEQHLAESQT